METSADISRDSADLSCHFGRDRTVTTKRVTPDQHLQFQDQLKVSQNTSQKILLAMTSASALNLIFG